MGKRDKERIAKIKAGMKHQISSRMLTQSEIEERLRFYHLDLDFTGTLMSYGQIELKCKSPNSK